MTIQWLVTAPEPHRAAHAQCEDAGQRGWRLHAVEAEDSETGADIKYRRSACGLLPSHGWTIDLFIDRECKHCLRALAKRQKQGT